MLLELPCSDLERWNLYVTEEKAAASVAASLL